MVHACFVCKLYWVKLRALSATTYGVSNVENKRQSTLHLRLVCYFDYYNLEPLERETTIFHRVSGLSRGDYIEPCDRIIKSCRRG